MSTQYCIVRKGAKVIAENGCIISINDINTYNELFDNDLYTIIGGSYGLEYGLEPLVSNLPEDTPVYALDNDTDLKTLKEYLEHINT